jgi:hypothetical protein
LRFAADILLKGIGTPDAQYYVQTRADLAALECTLRDVERAYVLTPTIASLGLTEGGWFHIARVFDDMSQTQIQA